MRASPCDTLRDMSHKAIGPFNQQKISRPGQLADQGIRINKNAPYISCSFAFSFTFD
jgi:hypothetical protein